MLTQHQRGDDHRRRTLHLFPHALFHLPLLRLTLPSHLPLSWPLYLPYPLPLSPIPPPNPTNGLPHCGRNVTTLICVAGREEGMFNGFFSFYLLREPCYVLMDSAAAA